MQKRLSFLSTSVAILSLFAALAIYSSSSQAKAQSESQVSRARWEYMTITVNRNRTNYAQELNRLAGRGWEYEDVLVEPYFENPGRNSDQIVILLKRAR